MCRLLVVDDDGDVAEQVRAWAEAVGFRVSVVPDGYSALRAIVDRRPDVVLSDQSVTRACGNQLAQMLGAHGMCLPMIRIAARHDGPSLPGEQVLAKPLDQTAVLTAITRLAPPTCRLTWPGSEPAFA